MKLLTVVFFMEIMLVGCVNPPADKMAVDVSTMSSVPAVQYEYYSCDEIVIEMKAVNVAANEHFYDLQDEKEIDAILKGIGGALLVWPVIIFLDNQDLFYETELTRLRNEHTELRREWMDLKQTAIRKECDQQTLPEFEFPKARPVPPQKFESIKL